MKLRTLRIVNFRCFDDVTLNCGSMHAFVGCNNAGKSTVLHALDFLFNPSTEKVSIHTFHRGIIKNEIRVEALFEGLTDEEKEAFKGYLRTNESFQMARVARWVVEEEEEKAEISQAYNKPQPKADWLNSEKINGESIEGWSGEKLVVGGRSFADAMKGTKPTVANWKAKAAEFAKLYLADTDYEDSWGENPKGFAGVLKGNLPHFDFIPAVRDVGDEAKVGKTNPFGRLIHSIVRQLDPGIKRALEESLSATAKRLNRGAGKDRLAGIADVESRLRKYIGEVIEADFEMEFEPPTIETILTTPTLWVNDGYRGPIDDKGHGLQRAVIMSILRAYADMATVREKGKRRTLILGFEEPELYMHPPILRVVRKVLRTIADGGDQVFFSTHSPVLVDVRYFDEIVRVESATKGSGARLYQLSMPALVGDLLARYPALVGKVTEDSIRQRYGHAYTSSRNEGFFARKVILVEGATELYALPVYAQAMGMDFDSLGIVVVECGSKDQIDRLYRVFNELGICCYVLFDYDLNGDGEDRSKHLLEWLGTKIDKPSTAVIEKRFGCFVNNWEKDLMVEIPDYEKLAGTATKELGLSPDSGKPLRARFIAEWLVSREKPIIPPTIEKLIRNAIEAKHVGSCLKD